MFEKCNGFVPEDVQGLRRGMIELAVAFSPCWYYKDIVAQKSDPDYCPYGYVEEEEEPVSSTGEDLLDWEWE